MQLYGTVGRSLLFGSFFLLGLSGLAAVPRLALVGGLAPHLAAWLSDDTQAHLTPALGDASSGAVALARAHADTMAEAG